MKQTSAIEFNDDNLGFTLIELMLVIAVIGILAIVSAPKYQAITDHYKLESSAQIVVGQLRYAKQLAMDQRTKIYLVMDTKTVEIHGYYFDDDDIKRAREYGRSPTFDSGVSFDSTKSNGLMNEQGEATEFDNVVQYSSRGFVENPSVGGGPIRIVLSSVRTDRSVAILVELGTGNIAVEW